MKKNSRVGYLFLTPFMIAFVLFLIIPTITGFYLSLTDYNGMSLANASFVGLDNYKAMFDSSSYYYSDFWDSLIRTFVFVLLITPAVIFIPLVLSYILNTMTYGKKIIKGMFYIPVVLSVSGIATLAAWVFDQKYGFLNYILTSLGFDAVPWLTNPELAFIAIVLLTIWWTMGGNLIIYIASMQGISTEMYEAADIEGANKITQFFKITIPSIKPQLAFTLIMSIIASFNIYGQPAVLTGGGPGKSTTTIAMYIRDTAFGSTQAAGMASAMGILFGIMMIAITFFQFKHVIKEM